MYKHYVHTPRYNKDGTPAIDRDTGVAEYYTETVEAEYMVVERNGDLVFLAPPIAGPGLKAAYAAGEWKYAHRFDEELLPNDPA